MTDDDDEAALLDAIRRDPADEATRLVYADWLEEHGDPERAAYMRADDDETAPLAGDAAWRSIVSRRRVHECVRNQPNCPQFWHAYAPVGPAVRKCNACGEQVTYKMRAGNVPSVVVVYDRAIPLEHAFDAPTANPVAPFWNDNPPPPPMPINLQPTSNPPPPSVLAPIEEEPKPGVLARIKGWFSRRS